MHILLLFSRLKVIYLFGFQIIFFLERVNKYATLRAWSWSYHSLTLWQTRC